MKNSTGGVPYVFTSEFARDACLAISVPFIADQSNTKWKRGSSFSASYLFSSVGESSPTICVKKTDFTAPEPRYQTPVSRAFVAVVPEYSFPYIAQHARTLILVLSSA